MNEANVTLLNARSLSTLDQEQQPATVLENTAIAILIFDSEGHLSFANPAGQKLFDDYEPKLGQKLPADSGYEPLQQLLDKARHSQVSLTEEEVVWPDKRIFSAELSPVQADSYFVTLYDVSRFKELEKLKNEFIASAAHDLRSPMTSIKEFNDLIKKVGPLNESQNEFLARIQAATENMEELVENMLNLTKLNLGAKQEFETFDLSSLIWELADEFQPHAEVKKQLLAVEQTEPISMVQGEPLKIRQAIRNLIGNAIKYTPNGGVIVISLEHKSERACISIKDTGYGIPSIDLPYIFDRFYRVRNHEHVEIKGNGLGLAIVKSIAEKHGGEVIVESEPGKGSCFTLILPLLVPVENKYVSYAQSEVV